MAIKVGNTNMTNISVDGTTINLVKDSDNNYLWARPFTLSLSGGTGVASVSVSRTSTYSPEGTIGTFSDGKIYYGDNIYISAAPSTGYELDAYTGSVQGVTGNVTVNVTAHLKSYTVTFALGGSNYGSWGSATKTAYHFDVISRSGDTVTCYVGSSSTVRWTNTFTNGSATGYTYSVSYNSITSPVTGAQTVTATTSRSLTIWHVYITAGEGISDVYLSTSSTATSGSSSGDYFQYGSTVYGFIVLAQYYHVDANAGWVLVSGTANETGAKYRVGSITVSTDENTNNNFGTKSAIRKSSYISLSLGTGVDKIYFRSPSSGNYTAYSSSQYITGYYGYSYDWYATAKSGYVMTGTTSGSGTYTGSMTISPTAMAFTLQEPTIYSYYITLDSGRYYKRFRAYNPNSLPVTLEYKCNLDSSNSTVTLAASGWTNFNSSGYSSNFNTANNAYLTLASVSAAGQSITMTYPICSLWAPSVEVHWYDDDDVRVTIENSGDNPQVDCDWDIICQTDGGDEWEESDWYSETYGHLLGPIGDFTKRIYTDGDYIWRTYYNIGFTATGYKSNYVEDSYEY